MARRVTALLTAGLLVSGCGVDGARPMANVGTEARRAQHLDAAALAGPVSPERDPLPVKEPVRLIPPAAASRGGERSSGRRAVPRPSTPSASGGSLTVSSTAYCERGRMANGQNTYDGAVAMNGQPMGSRWHVLSGPWAGRTLTVADRIGHGSSFDIAMPGRCSEALQYGRRQITVERVG